MKVIAFNNYILKTEGIIIDSTIIKENNKMIEFEYFINKKRFRDTFDIEFFNKNVID